MKYYRFNYDYVLWGISYANLSMLLEHIGDIEGVDQIGEECKESSKHHDSLETMDSFLSTI